VKKTVAAAVAALALLAVGGFVLVLRGPTVRTEGPIAPGAVINRGQPVDVGMDESFGYLLKNEGKQPAILERVRVVGVTGPIEVLGVWASLKTGDRGSFITLPGFPPPEYPSKPLAEEHVVPVSSSLNDNGVPNEGLQLAVGVRAIGEGFGRIRGIEFIYRVGNQRYRGSMDGYGLLCAPLKRFYDPDPNVSVEECSDEAAEQFDKKFVDFHVSEGASR
jgi:hypothetical protein